MLKKYSKKIIQFSLLAALLITLIILLHYISPEEIVNKLGVKNGYLLAFFVSLFGGFSAGGSITFIGLLITLVAGGMNPITLGIISGIALAIGDTIMFYAGSKGRELIQGKWDQRIKAFEKQVQKRKWLEKSLPFLAYLYVGFAPLPNDLLLLSLAAIEFPQKKMNIIIILGDITFALVVTLVWAKGISIL